MRSSLLAIAVAVGAMAPSAAAQIAVPVSGVVRTATGQLRTVQGVGGSFVSGEVLAIENPLAAAFDADGGLIQVEGAMLAVDRNGVETSRYQVPDGVAILSASGRAAYFASERSVWSFSSGARQLSIPAFEGNVFALGVSAAKEVSLAVRRDGESRLLRFDVTGSLLSDDAMPGDGGTALLLPGAVIYVEGAEVVWRDLASRVERRWALDAPPDALRSMGGGWIQAGESAIRWDREQVFVLPGVTDTGVTPGPDSEGRVR